MSVFIHNTARMTEGAGVAVNRLMPVAQIRNFDPFVLFDHFSLKPGVGFPEHPHRGFEAITYLFNGEIEHRDNLGHVSRVGAGGAQRFTAGAGLVHSEMPSKQGVTDGIQLWINLAKADKNRAPSYQEAPAETIIDTPVLGGVLREIVGANGPITLRTPVIYQHLQLDAGHHYRLALAPDWRAVVYLRDGEIQLKQNRLTQGQAALLEQESEISIQAVQTASIIIAAGRPHHQKIVQHGPYVD